MKKTLLALFATGFLAACSSTPTETAAPAPAPVKTSAAPVAPAQPLPKEPVTMADYPAKGVGVRWASVQSAMRLINTLFPMSLCLL